jgi:hypothetical protein
MISASGGEIRPALNCASIMTDTFTSRRIQKVQNLLESAGWCIDLLQWHPAFTAYRYNWLKSGDTIFQCQRGFETLIVIIHREDDYKPFEGLMQYHWAFNSQFASKGESVDYIKDFLAPFLATAQPQQASPLNSPRSTSSIVQAMTTPTVQEILAQTSVGWNYHDWPTPGGGVFYVTTERLKPALEAVYDPSMPNWPLLVDLF